MKFRSSICSCFFFCLASPLSPLCAQTPQSPPAAQTPKDAPQEKSLNDFLPYWLRINGSARGRWEDNLSNAPATMDSYYFERFRLDVLVKPVSWLSFFVQGQDVRVYGYDSGTPPSSYRDPFDLRQAYVQLGGGEGQHEMVRFGRQEITFGAGRVFGPSDWSNTARTFDVVRGAYIIPGLRSDFIAGSVVQIDPNRFDRHRAGEHVYGLYNVLNKLVKGATIEPYIFAKTQLNVTSETAVKGIADTYMFGTRFAGKTPGRIDYSAELLHQWGSYSSDRISAWGGSYTLGWTVNDSKWKPRLSGDYSHASGDNNPKDGVRRTFDLMYGNNQPFYSLSGSVGWKNLRDLRAGVDASLTKKLKVQVDYRDLYLSNAQDGLYNSAGTRIFLNRAATSTHIGDGVETQLTYQWPKQISTSVGLGTLFRGEYLKETSGRATYLYPFVAWTKKF